MASLYASVSGFVSRRRRPLTVLAGAVGGAYLVASYARSKLEDLQENLGRKRANRENLRRRFQQNQEDCGFTVLALLPTLGTQILEAMDVEALTAKLSSMGKARVKAPEPPPVPAPSAAVGMPALDPAEDAAAGAAGKELIVGEAGVAPTSLPNGDASTAHADASIPPKSHLDPHAPSFTPHSAPQGATDAAAVGTNGDAATNGTSANEMMPTDPSLLPSIPSAYDLSAHQPPAPEPLSVPATNGLDASTASLATPNASAFLPAKPINGFEALDVPPPVKLDASLTEATSFEPTPPAAPSASTSKLDGMSKAEVWSELKILAFSRLLTSIYCLALLTLQTHVQLNLLGRYAYVSSVLAMAESEGGGPPELPVFARRPEDDEPAKGVDLRTERRYLTFSWWLLHRGWEEVALRVREKVEEVLGPMGLKDQIGAKDLKKVFAEIRKRIETEEDGSTFSFAAALFPPTTISELETLRAGGMPPHDCVVDPPLRALLDETADFIDAPDFTQVLGAGVERVLSLVLEKVSETAGLGPSEPEAQETAASGPFIHPTLRFQELDDEGREKKVRLANLLPIVSRQAHTVLNGLPNECAEALEDTREILEYSSVIYTSFDS